MRISEIKALLKTQYHNLSDHEVSKVVQLAFPESHKERSTCVYGVRRRPGPPGAQLSHPIHFSDSTTISNSLPPQFPHNPSPLQSPEEFLCQSALQSLRAQNARLAERLSVLESENQELRSCVFSTTNPAAIFEDEVQKLSKSMLLFHGPDSLERLEMYTLDAVMGEVKLLAPKLLQLFSDLGNTQRNADESSGGLKMEEIKVLSSLCTS